MSGEASRRMKTKTTFEKVDLLLIDTDLNARQGVQTILLNNGFREITQGSDLTRLRDVVTRTMPDILLCGTEFPDGSIIETIRDIRHARLGSNPFMPIIVLLDEPTPEKVSMIMASGADDVTMKPISTKALMERIATQIGNRRPYIVTDDYVGPARKGDNTANAIRPPNPLQAKATDGKTDFLEVQRGIEAAQAEVYNKRLQNLGPEIASLVGKLVPMLDKPVVSAAAVGGLQMLIDINKETIVKLEGSKFNHVIELCRAMIKVAQSICNNVGDPPDRTQVKLLKPLSQAVQAGFSGGFNTVDAARQIAQRIGVHLD